MTVEHNIEQSGVLQSTWIWLANETAVEKLFDTALVISAAISIGYAFSFVFNL